MAKNQTPHVLTPFVAGILAWVVPGAGHVYLGRTVRGIVLCICINGLFWSGVAFGGVFTVDREQERWWYMAQMMTGISGAASWHLQKNARMQVAKQAETRRADAEAEGRNLKIEEAETDIKVESQLSLTYPAAVVSRAYSGIAGMLNLLCIFDAFMLAAMGSAGEPPPADPKDEQKKQTPRPGKPKESAA